jgi:hypothetical protein
MSKRTSQTPGKHERRKRWGKQQKALREKQLLGDMQHFVDNGWFSTDVRQQEALANSLWSSQDWRREPEFADLAFDPYLNQRALQQAWHEMEFDPDAFQQLSEDDQADENFQLHALAIERLLTPAFKQQFHARLEQFRQRLRETLQGELLAQASLVQLLLENDDAQADSAWPECMLIFQLHTEAVDRYLDLQSAAEAALEQALQRLGKTTGDALSDAEQVQLEELLQAADRATPGLLDFLDRSTDQAFDEALQAVRDAIFFVNLFSLDEADAFMRRFVAALVEANPLQGEPEALPSDETTAVDDAIQQVVCNYLIELDTPRRRRELYQQARTHLIEAVANAAEPLCDQAEILLQLVDDDTLPLAENAFFQAALMGEAHYHFQITPPQDDPSIDPDDEDRPDDLP